jgi:hypothetical protein
MRPGTAYIIIIAQDYYDLNVSYINPLIFQEAVSSLQRAGGIYSLVALSPSVGVYASGRFTSNVPMRIVQLGSQPNNSLDVKSEDESHPGIKQECQICRWRRQTSIPAVTTSYHAEEGAWQGSLRVTVCWRELLYTDETAWVKNNLLHVVSVIHTYCYHM